MPYKSRMPLALSGLGVSAGVAVIGAVTQSGLILNIGLFLCAIALVMVMASGMLDQRNSMK